MALSWNEIKDRALRFSKEWEGEKRERAEKDSFWNEFFNVFGISRRRVATFEEPVKKLNNNQGFIDLFWKGTLLVEHKSFGKDLDSAYEQATDYFAGLKEHELPKYILVSDFARFKLYDLDEKTEYEFALADFHKEVKLFGFIAGYQKKEYKAEDPVNVKAAELMGKLHDQLEESGYTGHELEVFLVRLLFCLFGDDTSIFEKNLFKDYLEQRTREDGSDLGMALAQFFQVLNTAREKRQKSLDEQLDAFPYVNGRLFEEQLSIAAFNSQMRNVLLQCCTLDWGKISPAIFGSMFQSVMNPEERRNLGAHYTSETNILKLIKPLFLDELWEEFERVKKNSKQLQAFHHKLGTLKFLDPACGCGNFLVITYRELRLLELEVLRVQHKNQRVIGVGEVIWVDVDQFYGIEYDEWPAKIAEVALWLMDHQMNMRIGEEFGEYFVRLPLKKSATIVHGNALRVDWESVVSKKELSFILGNPPFLGTAYQSIEQKEDLYGVFAGIKSAGMMDYVSAWYIKAAKMISKNNIRAAFVSTSSIAQGEQVGILWNEMFNVHHLKIQFAHKTFKWNNEAKGVAGVHVVIIGFGKSNELVKRIFHYDNVKGEPLEMIAKNINPYLVDGPDDYLPSRSAPICHVPSAQSGSAARDGGFLILSDDEKMDIQKQESSSVKYFARFISGNDFLNDVVRWCIWLKGHNPGDTKKIQAFQNRFAAVKDFREKSPRSGTKKMAAFPYLFAEERQPETDFLLIPKVSSENRKYIPIAYLTCDNIVSDKTFIIPDTTHYHFGVLTSIAHMDWMRTTCGRLESRYSYSNTIVFNNYPWPKEPSAAQKKEVEERAQAVLDARLKYPSSSLADLYDPLTMPPDLVKAHHALDKAVDKCYRSKPFANETERIEYLFELYNEYTAPLLTIEKKKK
jgi:type I restriction-modification system DNA methylase subunit